MPKFLSEEDKKKFAVTGKVGLITSIDEDNFPRITLISTIESNGDDELIWGEFCDGISKNNLLKDPKTSFLLLNTEKEWWRGKALQTAVKNTGKEFEKLNNAPLFRYNTYFGIGKAHYMKMLSFSGKQNLDMKAIIKGVLKGKAVKRLVEKSSDKNEKITKLSYDLAKGVSTLKFLSYVDSEGYPLILPVLQATIIDKNGRIIIPLGEDNKELENIEANAKIALYYANMELSSVLFQGIFKGLEKKMKIRYAVIDIEKVYNTMVPIVGYIYPKEDYKLIF